jgi:hypothetical protein
MRAVPIGKISTSFEIDCNSCETSYEASGWEQHEVTITDDSSWDDWLDAYIVGSTYESRYIECPHCDFKWMFDWRLYSVTDKEAVENAGIETTSPVNWRCTECEEEFFAKEEADECCL